MIICIYMLLHLAASTVVGAAKTQDWKTAN